MRGKYKKRRKDLELAWAAGFFDGEGNAGCYSHSRSSQSTYLRAMAQIAQVVRAPLYRFRRAVGCGKVTGPYTNNQGTRYYRWSIYNWEEFKAVKGQLSPYLSAFKKKQFDKAHRKALEFKAGSYARHVRAGKIAAGVRWGGNYL